MSKKKNIWDDICDMCNKMYEDNLKVLEYYYSTAKLKRHFFDIPFVTFNDCKKGDDETKQIVYTIESYAKEKGCKTDEDIYKFYANFWTDVLVDERYQSERSVLRDYKYIQDQFIPRCRGI